MELVPPTWGFKGHCSIFVEACYEVAVLSHTHGIRVEHNQSDARNELGLSYVPVTVLRS